MIAVYHVEDSSPYHLIAIDVESEDVTALLDKIKEMDYPLPENGEFLFIENDAVINQLCLYEVMERAHD